MGGWVGAWVGGEGGGGEGGGGEWGHDGTTSSYEGLMAGGVCGYLDFKVFFLWTHRVWKFVHRAIFRQNEKGKTKLSDTHVNS